jgi:hypothetical protein
MRPNVPLQRMEMTLGEPAGLNSGASPARSMTFKRPGLQTMQAGRCGVVRVLQSRVAYRIRAVPGTEAVRPGESTGLESRDV